MSGTTGNKNRDSKISFNTYHLSISKSKSKSSKQTVGYSNSHSFMRVKKLNQASKIQFSWAHNS